MTAVIAAAGSGERLGAGGPKAFVPLAGRSMLEWSVAAFRAMSGVESIVVACPPGVARDGEEGVPPGLMGDDLMLVEGGQTRAESVANALRKVNTDLVAIHDAARPLVTPQLIEGVAATACADPRADGAIAATPVTDTIKRTPDAGFVVEETVDRERLWAAQTPQVFRTDALRRAIDAGEGATATDEAMLIEAAGGRVLIHPSPPENLKVTTPLDLRLAELLLADRAGR